MAQAQINTFDIYENGILVNFLEQLNQAHQSDAWCMHIYKVVSFKCKE